MFPRVRLLTLVAFLALFALACGQKPGVYRGILAGQPGGPDEFLIDEDFEFEEGEVEVIEGDPADPQRRQTVRRQAQPGARPGQPGQPGAPGQPGTGATAGAADRTGVSDDEIVVGIHAPVTGAAPFPAESFRFGRDVYWTWSGAPTIHGRSVRVVFEDDGYDPRTAVDRCRKMATQDNAFLLVGGGGTDQIQACARWAAQNGVPYLSAGVTEEGIRGLPTYFALSMSYAQQAPLLWQMIQSDPRLDQTRVAMVTTNTPNFEDARRAFRAAMGNTPLVLDRQMSKRPSETEYNNMAGAIDASGAEVVFILTAPVHYVSLSPRLTRNPWWVGVGISKGLNDVLDTGCRLSSTKFSRAIFFSPFPGLDIMDEMDANYSRAYRDVNNNRNPDDLGFAFWGLSKTLHQLLEAAGRDLSRQRFMQSTQQAQVQTNVFPPLRFTPQNHFGADSTHVLKADCGRSPPIHLTEHRFARGF